MTRAVEVSSAMTNDENRTVLSGVATDRLVGLRHPTLTECEADKVRKA
jgi:hypothetical protein